MSTRTTGKRETLEERVGNRMFVFDENECGKHMYYIRAELARLARQVRKNLKNLKANHAALSKSKDTRDLVLAERCLGGIDSLNEVLDSIGEAKR